MKSAGRRSRSAGSVAHSVVFRTAGRRRGPGTDRKNPGAAHAGEAAPGPSDRDRGLPRSRRPRVTCIEGTNGANGSPLRTTGAHLRVLDLRPARDAQRGRWTTGQGQGVLIRAADPLDDWKAESSRRPGRLALAPCRLPGLQNGLDVTGDGAALPGQSRRSTGRAIDKTDRHRLRAPLEGCAPAPLLRQVGILCQTPSPAGRRRQISRVFFFF